MRTVPKAKVFVSYAHESAEHRAQVHAFAVLLRDADVEVVLDVWSAEARHDWYAWAIEEMTGADFVLVMASERYRVIGDGRGAGPGNRGVQSEAALLRELVYADRPTWTPKVLPVVLPGHTVGQIPLFLQPHTASHFRVDSLDDAGIAELLRVIRGSGRAAAEAVAAQGLPPRRRPNRGRTIAFAAAAAVLPAVVALVFALTSPDRAAPTATAAGHSRTPTPIAAASPPSFSSTSSPTTTTTTTRPSPPPTSRTHPTTTTTRPPFTQIRDFTPILGNPHDECQPSQLCAYRGLVGTAPQFDLEVNDYLIGVCMTVRADDPGFRTATAGSSRPIDLYPGRRCVGKPQPGPPARGNSSTVRFFSYVVRA